MQGILSFVMGYLIGCLHPAALLSRRRHVDLKQTGTGNLGATNTTLVLGRASGIVVLVVDVFKSYFAAKLARLLFPQLALAGMVASLGAILGHCFPVFLRFQGGKGLASYGGMVLAYDPGIFLMILLPGILLMLLLNTGVVLPLLASLAFPALVWLTGGSLPEILLSLAAGGFLLAMHLSNLKKALHEKNFANTQNFLREVLFKK